MSGNGLNAEADADVNIGIGLLGQLLKIAGNISIGINSAVAELQKANRMEQDRLDRLPKYLPISRMVQNLAAPTFIVDFDGPLPGRQWAVSTLTAVASPLAANAALVTWYVGQVMPGPAAGMLPSTMMRWQFPSVPAFEDFSPRTIQILPGEKLIAGLTGIPATSSITLTAGILDYPYPGPVE